MYYILKAFKDNLYTNLSTNNEYNYHYRNSTETI